MWRSHHFCVDFTWNDPWQARKFSFGGKLWASKASLEIFCSNHTHFSKYTHFSHPQITRSCTLHADHSSIPKNGHSGIVYHMVKNRVIIFKFTITEKFGGEAGVFGGEASPPSPPIDETLHGLASSVVHSSTMQIFPAPAKLVTCTFCGWPEDVCKCTFLPACYLS